jgi:hypothetical protein
MGITYNMLFNMLFSCKKLASQMILEGGRRWPLWGGGGGGGGGVCVEAVKGEIERLERVAEAAQVRP